MPCVFSSTISRYHRFDPWFRKQPAAPQSVPTAKHLLAGGTTRCCALGLLARLARTRAAGLPEHPAAQMVFCLSGDYWYRVLDVNKGEKSTYRELLHRLVRRPPIVTIGFAALLVAFYYGSGGREDASEWMKSNQYIYNAPWWRSWSAMYMHVDASHLWENVSILLVAGALLEVTEGPRHTLEVVHTSGVLSMGFHALLIPSRFIAGASGAIYAILWSQLAVLALNWSDMPTRWLRALGLTLLLGGEVLVYYLATKDGSTPRTSYPCHVFGALTGVCVSLVSAENVRYHRAECLLNAAGIVGFVALTVAVFVSGQVGCATLALAIAPMLAVEMWWNLQRLRRTDESAKAARVAVVG